VLLGAELSEGAELELGASDGAALSQGADETEGSLLGDKDGASEGASLGESESEGSFEGLFDGLSLGAADSDGAFDIEGSWEGATLPVGSFDGFELGFDDGGLESSSPEGESLGSIEGSVLKLGPKEGSSLLDGASLGVLEGSTDGWMLKVGMSLGAPDIEGFGEFVGFCVLEGSNDG